MRLPSLFAAVLALVLASCANTPPPGAVLAQGTNAAFSHEVTSAAPPEAVWVVWMDVSNWPTWDKGLKGARTEAPLALGTTGTIVPLSGPESQFKVTAFQPGVSYAFTTALPLAQLTVTRTIIGQNPTRFRHDVRFEGALAGVWAGQFGPGFRAALPPTMEAVAARAEGRAP